MMYIYLILEDGREHLMTDKGGDQVAEFKQGNEKSEYIISNLAKAILNRGLAMSRDLSLFGSAEVLSPNMVYVVGFRTEPHIGGQQ